MTDLDMPLPEPMSKFGHEFNPDTLPAIVIWYTADHLRARDNQWRAIVAAEVAKERERWREIAEQLIACHDEPTCPAVTLARERLDAAAIRAGSAGS